MRCESGPEARARFLTLADGLKCGLMDDGYSTSGHWTSGRNEGSGESVSVGMDRVRVRALPSRMPDSKFQRERPVEAASSLARPKFGLRLRCDDEA